MACRFLNLNELGLIVPLQHPLAECACVACADPLDYDYIGLSPGTSLGKAVALRIQAPSFDAIPHGGRNGRVGIMPGLAVGLHTW